MEVYVKISFISVFSFFLVFKHDFIRCFYFTRMQLQIEQVMTIPIIVHTYNIEYRLIIFLCSFCSQNRYKKI